jgi:singapore isolate B (sub-type 7) whole genome shotgun sequence assembly, scaffold_2
MSNMNDSSGCYLPTPYTGLQALRAGLITDTFFFVHHVFHHNTAENVVTSEQSIARAVKKLSRQDDVYERLAESLAPEIYGHSDIKKALLLQLISPDSSMLL